MKKGFTDTKTDGYRKKLMFFKIKKAAVNYALLPTVLCSMLLGGVFTVQDAFGAGAADAKLPGALQASASLPDAYVLDEENEIVADFEVPDTGAAGEDEADIYFYDPSLVPAGEVGIVPISLACTIKDGVMNVRNASKYDINCMDYAKLPFPVKYEPSEEYQVLIVHTHSTEAYTAPGIISADPDNPYVTRSDDKEYNMIGVGDVFERVFDDAGIKTLHCEVAIDKASYTKAYENAAKLIQAYLEEYPSIKYVFDIHRDAVSLSTGEKAKLVCSVNGKTAAQIMFVVGTDTLGQNHPDWENNLAFAVQLQLRLMEKYTDFVRPINVKQGAFNQQYSRLGLLIEVGSDGNTLEEAEYSAEILALEIADLLKSAG